MFIYLGKSRDTEDVSCQVYEVPNYKLSSVTCWRKRAQTCSLLPSEADASIANHNFDCLFQMICISFWCLMINNI